MLFHTRVLENQGHEWREHPQKVWNSQRYDCADRLWHEYLVFRCRDRSDNTIDFYVEVRSIVDALIEHRRNDTRRDDDSDWETVLDKVCWFILSARAIDSCAWRPRPYGWWVGRRWSDDKDSEGRNNTGLGLLSAATYLGYMPLVRNLLAQGYDPLSNSSWMFPSPILIAAWAGQADILQLMQEQLPDPEDGYHCHWRYCIGYKSLHGAAFRGDMGIVRLCLYPPSRLLRKNTSEADTSIAGFDPGSIPAGSSLGSIIGSALCLARTLDVYKYLSSLINNVSRYREDRSMDEHLVSFAGTGNMSLVRHVVGKGADISYHGRHGTALAKAVRSRQEDIVDFLLEQGADPNGRAGLPGTALTAAVKTGSMRMVRKILDAGANIHYPNSAVYMLRRAVEMEHTAMVELLLDLGITSDIAMACALWGAEKKGLESMTDLLRSRGASLTPWIHPPTPWVPPVTTPCARPSEDAWKQEEHLQFELEPLSYIPF